MSLSKTFVHEVHEVATWRVYPRVHYFQRRYNELLPRFDRLINAFPKSFHDERELREIHAIDKLFQHSLKVVSIGRRRPSLRDIVVTEKALGEIQIITQKLLTPSKITVFVCCIQVHNDDSACVQQLEEVFAVIERDFRSEYPDWIDSLFVVIEGKDDQKQASLHSLDTDYEEHIREKILERLKKNQNDWKHDERVVFGLDGSALASVISEFLECKIIDGFSKVMVYLEHFVRDTKSFEGEDIDVVHSHPVILSLQGLLRDVLGMLDIHKLSQSEESEETSNWTAEEKCMHQLLKKLAMLIKCSIVGPCSSKYNLPCWVVNQLLVELNLESKIINVVSTSTKYNLSKFLKISEIRDHEEKLAALKGKRGGYKFDFLVQSIQNDISKVVNDTEKTMASACRIVTIMEKMLFEIEGYLEQTIVQEFQPKTVTPKLPNGLREEILRLKDVYGVGIIYNTLEVHLKKETGKDDTEAGDETTKSESASKPIEQDSDKLKQVRNDLRDILNKYSFKFPYKLKYITQGPLAMFADIQHENGKLIKSRKPHDMASYRSGTLGAFAEAHDHSLFVLTCAHVVCNPDTEEHDVFIQDRGLKLKKIGVSTRSMTVCSGNGPLSVIDFAAVKVEPDMERMCIRRIKDENGLSRRGRIVQDSVGALYKRAVYKYGAFSGFTRGVICSSDFGLSDENSAEDMYLMLIEALPGSETTIFAVRGDSGAVICMPDILTDDVNIVSMLSGGDYKVGSETTPKYLSFLLKTGLQKLKDISNIELTIP